MKKFNLFNEIITTNTTELKNEIASGKEFAINIYGEIRHEPFSNADILIYCGVANKDVELEKSLGDKYQVVVSDDRVLIKAFSNWQELIAINTPLASYDDTTADGVAEFSHKDIEEIGWQATEFDIKYRELVEVLEDSVDGTVLCIEQEDPYQFSGFGFFHDNEKAKAFLYDYCKQVIKDKMANDSDYEVDDLDDDQIAAKEFFGL